MPNDSEMRMRREWLISHGDDGVIVGLVCEVKQGDWSMAPQSL